MGCRVCAEGSEGALVAPSLLISRFAQGYTFFTLRDHVLEIQILCSSHPRRMMGADAQWVYDFVIMNR